MTKSGGSTPNRLTIDITPEQYYDLNKIFDYGERKIYFAAVVDATIELYNRVGKIGIYAVISGQAEILSTLASNKGVE